MDKRAAAHFEMIMSFILFIGVVTFLLLVIRPYNNDNYLSETVLDETYSSFEDYSLTNLSKFLLSVERPDTSTGCFEVSLDSILFNYPFSNSFSSDINFAPIGRSSRSVAGNQVESEISSFGSLKIDSSFNSFNVFISPEFELTPVTTSCNSEISSFDVGQIIERKVVSYKKLEELNNLYYSDYEGLKSVLKIPSVYDFAITFDDFESLNMEKEIPVGVDVYSKVYLREVLNSDGVITNSKITIRVW